MKKWILNKSINKPQSTEIDENTINDLEEYRK